MSVIFHDCLISPRIEPTRKPLASSRQPRNLQGFCTYRVGFTTLPSRFATIRQVAAVRPQETCQAKELRFWPVLVGRRRPANATNLRPQTAADAILIVPNPTLTCERSRSFVAFVSGNALSPLSCMSKSVNRERRNAAAARSAEIYRTIEEFAMGSSSLGIGPGEPRSGISQ